MVGKRSEKNVTEVETHLDPQLTPAFTVWLKGFTLTVSAENKDSLIRMYLLEDLSYYTAEPGT